MTPTTPETDQLGTSSDPLASNALPPVTAIEHIPANLEPPQHWVTAPVAPWRRYGARILDTSLNGLVGFSLISFVWYQVAPLSADAAFSVFEGPAGRLLDVMTTVVVAGLVNTIVLASLGGTLGKLVFGIRVERLDGRSLGLGDALFRESYVWAVGFAFGIPLISLLTMWMGFANLRKDGTTAWDKDRFQVSYRTSGSQAVFNALGVFLIIAIHLGIRSLGQL